MAITAVSASAFTSGFGINTHLSDTLGPYGNLAQVKAELAYIGIGTVRDSNALTWSLANFAALANAGIKLDLGVTPNPGYELGGSLIQNELDMVARLIQLAPGSVIALEGQNEPWQFPDMFNGQSTNNWTTVVAVQNAIYAAFKTDSALAGIPLLSPSVDPTSFSGNAPSFAASADLGDTHVYPWGGNQPLAFIAAGLAGQQTLVSGRAAWITEFGYSDTPGDAAYGVDDATQAKNTLNGLLDAFKLGAARTFLYELNDETSNISPNTAFGKLGLFNADGSAKPVAIALHNLTSVLADPASSGTSFTPGSLDLTVTGLPTSGSQLLLEKSSGVFDLVLWTEATDYDASTQTDIPVTAQTVSVSTSTAWASASIFDPLASSTATASYTNIGTIKLALTDHPIILEIKANSGATASAGGAQSNTNSVTTSSVVSSSTTQTSATSTNLTPAIKILTGNRDGGVTLAGSSAANSTVTVTDSVNGTVTVLGTAQTSSTGSWSLTSHVLMKTSVVHDYGVSAQDAAGHTGSMAGQLILASTGQDTLTGTSGAADVFAIMSFKGSDVIQGFETSAAAGSVHDTIDFSGRGITSFNQVQSMMSGGSSAVINIGQGKTVTLAGVAVSSLTAADFRYS